MTYPVTVTHPTQGSFNFLASWTDGGWPTDVPLPLEEELRSPGVDGARYRTLGLQEKVFNLSTIVDATAYALAITTAQSHMQLMDGNPVVWSVTMGGALYRYLNVHVLNVTPKCNAGPVVGANALSNSAAWVLTQWQLRLLDTTAQGQTG